MWRRVGNDINTTIKNEVTDDLLERNYMQSLDDIYVINPRILVIHFDQENEGKSNGYDEKGACRV